MTTDVVDRSPAVDRPEPCAKQYAFLFTDLVNSTGLKGQLNAWKYVCNVLEPHDQIFRQLLSEYQQAHEIKHLGDGFLAIFGDVRDAVAFSLRFQAAIRDYPWELDHPGQRVMTRIGIDIGFAIIKSVDGVPVDVFGPNVDVASRVMSAADGERTLMSATAFEIASPAKTFIEMNLQQAGLSPAEIELIRHGEYRIQGIERPLVLCEACLKGTELRAPKSNPPKVVNVEDEHWEPESADGVINPSFIPDRPGWKLVEKLGEGSFGTAFLGQEADDAANQRVFKFCRSADRLPTMRNELELLKQIKHLKRGDITAYLGAHLDRPPYFLEFEYVEGGNLSEWSQRQGGLQHLPLEARLEIFAKIAHAVAAAHRERVFHLDLKPSNILMDPAPDGGWQPKLTDFGIGVKELAGASAPSPGGSPRYSDGGTSGRTATHMYIPPEATDASGSQSHEGQPLAATLDVQDVYALGVLLLQFAVGDLQRPLAPSAIRQVPQKLLRQDIEDATHFDPHRRLASAAELERRVLHLKSRERRRFITDSFVPAVSMLVTVLVFVSTLCVLFYDLYQETDAAKIEALEARQEVERQYQEKLKNITSFWPTFDSDDDLPIHAFAQAELQRVQLLRSIRGWLLEQAEKDLEELQQSGGGLENQLGYAKLTLQISQLIDRSQPEDRQRRLEVGLAALKRVSSQDPKDPALRMMLSDFEGCLAQTCFDRGLRDDAIAHLQNCLDLRKHLLEDAREIGAKYPLPTWEYERKYLASINNLAMVRLNLATSAQAPAMTTDRVVDDKAAIDQLQSALEGREQLAQKVTPKSAILLRDWASSQYAFGYLLRRQSEAARLTGDGDSTTEHIRDAREHYSDALDHFMESQDLAQSAVTRQRIVETLRELVDLEFNLGNYDAAVEYRDEMMEQVAIVLPTAARDLIARLSLTDAKFSLAKYRSSQRPDDLPVAKADLRVAEHLYRTLLKLEPENVELWGDLGVIESDLGGLLSDSTTEDDRKEAAEKLQLALKAWDTVKLRARDRFRREFAEGYQSLEDRLKADDSPASGDTTATP